ncbi:MAG: AI-2E family transporter [Candidatus Saccharibacteria bacterium]
MKMHIDIDTKTFIRFWLVVIGFGLVGLSLYAAWPALLIVGLSLFLAVALNPSVSRIARALNSKNRVISTALAYVVVIATLAVIIFLVIPPVVEQTTRFIQSVPAMIDSATNQYSAVSEFVAKYNLQAQFDQIISSLKGAATQFTSGIGTGLITGIGSIVSVFTNTILVLVLTFLMLAEGPVWVDRFWGLYKDKKRMVHHRETVKKMYNVVTGYVAGQLTIAAIAGVLSGVVVFILGLTMGVPSNLSIPAAAIIFVLSLIPFFGGIIGAFSIGLVLAFNNPTAAIIFLIYYIIYQQFEGNFIGPKIQSKKMDLSPLIILISIVIGIMVFGIAGGIISIPIAGCIGVLFKEYLARAQANKDHLSQS